MLNFSIGCDPEIFVADAVEARSVIGKVGGTKSAPMPLPIGEGFAVQEDNVALEFNIPPAKSKAEFIESMMKATDFLEGNICAANGWHFDKRSAISFSNSELNDPRAFVFGCDPDFDAWTGRVNPRPHSEDITLRSAGGHVHIGCSHLGVDIREVVKFMDLHAGVPSVIMDNGVLRKQLYGKRGAFRAKSFGVEYRTLSNFWIFDKKLVDWVYRATERALADVLAGKSIDSERKTIATAINKNNQEVAMSLIEKYNLELA